MQGRVRLPLPCGVSAELPWGAGSRCGEPPAGLRKGKPLYLGRKCYKKVCGVFIPKSRNKRSTHLLLNTVFLGSAVCAAAAVWQTCS